MKRLYTINIQNSYVAILSLDKQDDIFYVRKHHIIEPDKLFKFLKSKKSYYLSIEQDEVIDEKISIKSIIKSDSVIKNLILRQLYENKHTQKNIFNYYPVSKNQKDEQIIYQIDGVHEKNYLSQFNLIPKWDEIKSATINKFSLLGISSQCIKEKSYFSIHIQSNKITTIAVNDNVLVFSRVNIILSEDIQDKKINLVEEIVQTITYAQQQFREIDFSLIAISGSIFTDDVMIEHIYMSSGLSVSSLYPNTFIKGLENEKLQEYIFSIGSLFVTKKYQFIPKLIHGVKQYAFASKFLLWLSICFILIGSLFAYEKFTLYYESLQKYEQNKSILDKATISTDIYSIEELDKSLKYLQMSQKYMKHHPIDMILDIKHLIELQKPQELIWSYDDKNLKLSATFKRSFSTLKELYMFEKDFFDEVKDINSTLNYQYLIKSDYEKMEFHTIVTVDNSAKGQKVEQQTRRRR
ncbi:MAG TPA: hypothetical protein VLZ29_05210 [Sulfurimonas sp.]|uniref:hypothetical protein n=1 Tax=Sulfurimonas sp. TaxID=2022749 RepID=UPI002C054967|nr:hypothetical protein [Sulfurimonas sp.]HUH42493.1 hypothetical protein [Sulfurimonas sp.]